MTKPDNNYTYWTLNDYIPSDVCDVLLKNNSDWETGQIQSEEEGDNLNKHRISDVSWVTNEFWNKTFLSIIRDVNHQWGINFDIQAIQSPQLTRYVAPGGHYDYHLDSTGVWPESDSGLVRKLSMVCLLNDRSEFEGGDFEFKLCSNPMQISLNKGDVLVFPSYILHRVTTVTKATRYYVFCWALGDMFK